jgi:hypothetical protein
MRRIHGRLLGASVALVIVAVGVAVAVWWASRDDDGSRIAATNRTTTSALLARPEIPKADAARYAALYRTMTVKQTPIGILRKWPEPYQRYRDNLGEQCYEWKAGRRLYNLCFKHGVLALKDPG